MDLAGRRATARLSAGPAGYETFMVHLDAAGRLERIENVST